MKKYFDFKIWSTPVQENIDLSNLIKFIDVLSWMYNYYFIKEEQTHSFKLFIYLCEIGRFHFEQGYEVEFQEHFNRMQKPHDAYTIRLNINYKYLSLEVIHAKIIEVLGAFSKENTALNTDVISKIYQKILDNNFQFKEYCSARISNPKGEMDAQFCLQEDMEDTGGFVAFWENEKIINRVKFKPRGYQLIEEQFLGYWLNNTSFKIYSSNKHFKGYWIAYITGEVEFIFDRSNSGNPHHLFMLGKMYFSGELVLEDKRKGIELIKKAANQGYKHALNWLKGSNSIIC